MPYQVVVIGTGFGGIGMAIALKRAGIAASPVTVQAALRISWTSRSVKS